MATTIVTAPTVEPVTLAEAKSHLNITGTNDDTYISTLITAARLHAEQYTGRVFVTQTWDLFLDEFPDVIEIPYTPLQSVTSVKYIDTSGAQQTLSSSVYSVDADSTKGLVYEAYEQSWPETRDVRHAVEVRFVAGYADSGASPEDLADNVPQAIKHAILLLVGHLYEHREAVSDFQVYSTPMAFESLLSPYVVPYQ